MECEAMGNEVKDEAKKEEKRRKCGTHEIRYGRMKRNEK